MHGRVINPRHNGTAHVLQPLDSVQAAVRLHGHNLHPGRQLAQAPAGADDGAARTRPGDDKGDVPGRLRENFWTARSIVADRITRIVAWIGIQPLAWTWLH